MKINFFVDSSRQKVAFGTALLTVGIGVAGYRHDLDMPHLHSEVPVMPTSSPAVYAAATNAAGPVIYSLSVSGIVQNK